VTPTGQHAAREASPWATGFAAFASVMMTMLGSFHAIMGLVALLNDDFFVRLPNYTFRLDVTEWGWIHVIAGAIVGWAGISLISGRVWARAVGIVGAFSSAREQAGAASRARALAEAVDGRYAKDGEEAAHIVAELVSPGDVVLVMGAGDVRPVGERLLELLRTPV